MGIVIDLLVSVAGNLVFWLVLGSAVWLQSTSTRRRFLRFFGLTGDQGVTVHLSNLWMPSSEPRPVARPAGSTISLHEFRAAEAVGKLFGAAPLRLPDVVRGLIDGLWMRRVAEPRVVVTPPHAVSAAITTDSIVVGGASRNSVRATYLRNELPFIELDYEHERWPSASAVGDAWERYIVITRGVRKGERVQTGLSLAVLEKVYDPERAATIFFCAGTRADLSWAATEYLARNWAKLDREFGQRGFALGLGFPPAENYMDTYVQPQVLIRVST